MEADKIFWASMLILAANISVVIKIFYRIYWERKVLMDFPNFKYQRDCKIILLMFIFLFVLFMAIVLSVMSIIGSENYGLEEKLKLILAIMSITAITGGLYLLHSKLSILWQKSINDYNNSLAAKQQ